MSGLGMELEYTNRYAAFDATGRNFCQALKLDECNCDFTEHDRSDRELVRKFEQELPKKLGKARIINEGVPPSTIPQKELNNLSKRQKAKRIKQQEEELKAWEDLTSELDNSTLSSAADNYASEKVIIWGQHCPAQVSDLWLSEPVRKQPSKGDEKVDTYASAPIASLVTSLSLALETHDSVTTRDAILKNIGDQIGTSKQRK